MTIHEALTSLCALPIPDNALLFIEERRGLEGNQLLSNEVRESKEFRLAESDVYEYAANSPSVSEGGVSITISDTQRNTYRQMAESIRTELGVGTTTKTKYGYKGSRL